MFQVHNLITEVKQDIYCQTVLSGLASGQISVYSHWHSWYFLSCRCKEMEIKTCWPMFSTDSDRDIHTYALATVFLLDNSICQTAHTFKGAWVGVCLTIRATHWIQVCCYHHGTHTQCLATNHFTLMVWMCTQTRFSTRICEKRQSDNL